jgi:hypothetical protein
MTTLTITVWHNVARGHAGRPTAMLNGYRPGDPMVCVFRYQVAADRRSPEAIAEEAFAAFNGHPASPQDAGLARRYYQRRLRSLSFPGNPSCCCRSCDLSACAACVVRIAIEVVGGFGLMVAEPLPGWAGPVLADVLKVLAHKAFGRVRVMAHNRGEQGAVLLG